MRTLSTFLLLIVGSVAMVSYILYRLIINQALITPTLWFGLALWGLVAIVFIVFLISRGIMYKIYKHDYHKAEQSYTLDLASNEYYYHAPRLAFANQTITVHGNPEMSFQLHTESKFQNWLYIYVGWPLTSIELTSADHKVELKRINPFSLRVRYHVYVDNQYVGIYRKKRLIREKAYFSKMAYKLITENETIELDKGYESTVTQLTHGRDKLITAFKGQQDEIRYAIQVRGISQKLRVEKALNDLPVPIEILIALYVQTNLNSEEELKIFNNVAMGPMSGPRF
ncbi:hypothetical protein PZN53_08655 [Staphylococcus pettenkoferi]|uniref:hypothetical protein n=1 Tax=Staphylococcus pettenkoferi TaxID=170573 RepID=UPI0024809822|nr:hypothetical protein [Staphylococcus pettenkoferi]MDH9616601.1 hypothetical protein [Staphylococcus pettenkoferi]